MINVTCEVKTLQDEQDVDVDRIIVESHDHDSEKVYIKIGDQDVTVFADDMMAAITNATRTKLYSVTG